MNYTHSIQIEYEEDGIVVLYWRFYPGEDYEREPDVIVHTNQQSLLMVIDRLINSKAVIASAA